MATRRSACSRASLDSASSACGTSRWARSRRCSSRSRSRPRSRSRWGSLAARSDRFERWSRGVLDAMQTMPAFVYLVPVLLLFEPGRVPAIIASFIYALPVGDPADEPRDPPGADGHGRGGRLVRVDRPGSCCARCSCRSAKAVDPARREPDHHDGPVRSHHRRADRRSGPGTGGRVRTREAADRSWRRGGDVHPAPCGVAGPADPGDGCFSANDARSHRRLWDSRGGRRSR